MLKDNKFLVSGIKGAKNELEYILTVLKNIKDVVIDLYVITPFGLNHIQSRKSVIKDVEDISKNIANYDLLLSLRGLLLENNITIRKCYYGRQNLINAGGSDKIKYFYAIKEGVNGVVDTIVDSWEECEPLVKGGLCVYKKFLTKEECIEYFKTVDIGAIKEKAKLQQERNYKLKKLKEEYTEVNVWLRKDIVAYLSDKSKSEGINVAKLLNNLLDGVMKNEFK